MAINYEEAKLKLQAAFPQDCQNSEQNACVLIEMLREERPILQLYDFICQNAGGERRDVLKNLATEYWGAIQRHRNKNKMEKEYVNLHTVYNIVNSILGEPQAKEVVGQLLPHTTRLKPAHSKRVDMLIKVLKNMNFREKYNLAHTEEQIAQWIDEKGVQVAIPQILESLCDEKVIADVEEQICKQMKRDLLPCTQKKVRTDPLANIISRLDFYHNYGIELRTDEIAKQMHQRGIRKVLRELLLEQFGWKEVNRVEEEITSSLARCGIVLTEHDKSKEPPHERYALSP